MKQVGNGKGKNKGMKKFQKVNTILVCIFLAILMLSFLTQIVLFILSDSNDLKSCICAALSVVLLLLSAYGFANNIFIFKLTNIENQLDDIEKMLKEIKLGDQETKE